MFGKGALLWLIGIPLPIIRLLAIFMHHCIGAAVDLARTGHLEDPGRGL